MKSLTERLKALGHTKGSFADAVGISRSTVYSWKAVPRWVSLLLEAWEEIGRLQMSNCSRELEVIEQMEVVLNRYSLSLEGLESLKCKEREIED